MNDKKRTIVHKYYTKYIIIKNILVFYSYHFFIRWPTKVVETQPDFGTFNVRSYGRKTFALSVCYNVYFFILHLFS